MPSKKYQTLSIISLIFLSVTLSCKNDAVPLPRGYFRIALPDKEFRTFDSIYPYSFEYPAYAQFVPDTKPMAEEFWGDLYFEQFAASIHLSYKNFASAEELNLLMEDGRNFVNRHIPKATGFNERMYSNEENGVFGVVYEIQGKEAASPMQFFLTDSTQHFLRGALYFNVTPNNDSLSPVIHFIRDDVFVMIESLEWE